MNRKLIVERVDKWLFQGRSKAQQHLFVSDITIGSKKHDEDWVRRPNYNVQPCKLSGQQRAGRENCIDWTQTKRAKMSEEISRRLDVYVCLCVNINRQRNSCLLCEKVIMTILESVLLL